MSLTGVFITWSYAQSGATGGNQGANAQAVLPYKAVASEAIPAAGTSQTSAPMPTVNGRPLLSIAAQLAIYYAVGSDPDLVNGPMFYFDPATQNGRDQVFADVNDKFAWKAA